MLNSGPEISFKMNLGLHNGTGHVLHINTSVVPNMVSSP